jgi:hypothetical protein
MEATETEVQPSNINSEDGFLLNISWKSLIQTLKEFKEVLPKKSPDLAFPHSWPFVTSFFLWSFSS